MSPTTAPGPKGAFLLGNTLQVRRGFLAFITDATRTYGDLVRFRFGLTTTYLLNHPDYVHEMLVKQADKFYKTRVVKRVLTKTFGNGIIISDGEFHRQQRRLVQPSLHTKRIETYSEVMIEHILRMVDQWSSGQIVDIHYEMTRLTMGVVAEAFFGADVAETAQQVSAALTAVVEVANKKFGAVIQTPDWLPTARNRRARRANRTLNDILMRIIDEHEAAEKDQGDFLSMLLMSADEESGRKMTRQQARDEAMTLFLGGHETTTIAITWIWYLLAQHPEVEAQVLAEIHSVLGDRLPTMGDLPQLKYMTMVINEALRLYPAVWIFSREPIEDVTIGGYTIKKGDTVFVCPYLMQRDPRYFEEPDKFIPERFTEGYEKRIPRYAYYPFGGGPRICIGQSFAMTEIKLIMALVAPRYQLTLVPGQHIEPKTSATLRPKQRVQMQLVAREKVAEFLTVEPS